MDTYASSKKGWDLETVKRIDEPAVDRWGERSAASDASESSVKGDLPFFRLSGGIMKTNARTSNRIDDLLRKLVEDNNSSRYMPNIDKNLDYLYTYLKLDMIGRVANDVSEMSRRRSETAQGSSPAERALSEE
ncbi:MAG: hypothetical protein KJ672_03925 [Candidatus Thermoplasmatota archaeon]|nr:hypothetical protein [Candidatus Thermoplasmatota archaeon]